MLKLFLTHFDLFYFLFFLLGDEITAFDTEIKSAIVFEIPENFMDNIETV